MRYEQANCEQWVTWFVRVAVPESTLREALDAVPAEERPAVAALLEQGLADVRFELIGGTSSQVPRRYTCSTQDSFAAARPLLGIKERLLREWRR